MIRRNVWLLFCLSLVASTAGCDEMLRNALPDGDPEALYIDPVPRPLPLPIIVLDPIP